MNYRLVLRAGLPGEPLLGRPAIPGLSVKFNGGEAIVNDETVIKMMLENPAYNGDYFCADNLTNDPLKALRDAVEPAHVVTEFKYGHVENVKKTQMPVNLSPGMKKMIQEEAMRIAKEMISGELQKIQAEKARKESILGVEIPHSVPPPNLEGPEPKVDPKGEVIVPGGIEGLVIAPELPPRPVAPVWSPDDTEDTEGFAPPVTGPAEEAPAKKKGRPPKSQ